MGILNNNFSSSFWRSNRLSLTLLLNMATGRKTVNIVKVYCLLDVLFLFVFFNLFFPRMAQNSVTNSACELRINLVTVSGERRPLVQPPALVRVSSKVRPGYSALCQLVASEGSACGGCVTFLSNLLCCWTASCWHHFSLYPLRSQI